MKSKLISAISFAFEGKLNEMQEEINLIVKEKILESISTRKAEICADVLSPDEDVSESYATKMSSPANRKFQSTLKKRTRVVKPKLYRENEDAQDDLSENLDEYEIVKTKGGYVDDEGNFVSDKSGGKNWQRSWTKRKRPSGFTSALQPGARIYHNVPFKQKDEAKAEGMKFDGDKKKWYHTDSTRSHYSKFEKLKEDTIEEKHMSSSEKKKEKTLKAKYDPSEMKQKMIDQYGPEKGKQVYFATIRKQAMSEDEINEADVDVIKKHYNTLSNSEFKQRYGHPKHIIARIYGWG